MRTMTRTTWMRLLLLAVILHVPCSMFNVSAQIKIGGNVYGGGNQGEVKGSTSVTVYEGNIGVRPENSEEDPTDQNPLADPLGKVFGGARMANVGGNAYVNIDGANASGDIVINQVYGGNDISGTIGTIETLNAKLPEGERKTLPTEIAGNEDGVDLTWNTYIHLSTKVAKENTTIGNVQIKEGQEMPDAKKIYIGQLFGGGNGDFTYTDDEGNPLTDGNGNYIVMQGSQVIAISKTGFNKPVLQKTYLDVQGGSIVYAYGGGNNATIEEKTVIHVDNPSKVVNSIKDENEKELLTLGRFKDMGINLGFSKPSSDEFQIGSFFGGNNKADMAIRPTWHLQDGKIRNLYSGGNRGRMIYEKGLFLEIPATSTIVVDNLYGGCRMADVRPMRWNGTAYVDVESISETISGYAFPDNLAARVIVAGGDVNNVYGGNDVRGKVYFGNAVGIQTSVRGNVYGGGNGSYPYTDIQSMEDDATYGDFFYSPEGYDNTLDALNGIRPDAEQVSIQVRGKKDESTGQIKYTVIGGSIYVGGNSATLKTMDIHKNLPNYPLTELKIGSYVIADNVFLGNNGEDMVSMDLLERYSSEGHASFNLTDPSVFSSYMDGVALSQVPRLIVEEKAKGDRFDYEPYTSYVGSLFYGSNRGSMTYSGRIDIDPVAPIYIYNKLVAGCNNANIPKSEYNARYEGGILGSASEQDNGYVDKNGKIKDRVKMDLSRIRLLPMRLNSTKTGLEWNTYNLNTDGKYVPETLESDISTDTNLPEVKLSTGNAESTDISRRLVGGNIYGGCCESGHVNGNVIINLNTSLLNRHDIFDAFEGEEKGDDILYERDSYKITARKSGVILNEQGMDVLGEALSVYGGGKGAETEIWGSATVNIKKGYTFQVFGGSENGVIGKHESWQEGTLNEETHLYEGGKYNYSEFDEKYSTTVNLQGPREGKSRADDTSDEMADVEFIYGGGNNGLIVGNTRVNLDNGRLFNSFAGSCNADILGHTETYVGQSGFPYLRDHIYGGNDLGGEIKGSADFSNRVSSEEILSMVHVTDANNGEVKDVLKANAYVEYRRGRMNYIHGGCFGDYDYDHEFTSAKGYSFPKLGNAFVNFRPDDNNNNHVEKVFGAGEGYPGFHGGDKMQDRSYVLVDIADTKTYYLNTEVFGGGNNNGLGMGFTPDETFAEGFNLDQASAIVDLLRGQIGAAYGGSYNEGVTRRTVLNVPQGSTIKIGSIFGGAYGTQILPPCDVYESNVNYHSSTARLIYDPGNVKYANADPDNSESVSLFNGAIYGGNNNERRTLYARVNIDVPVAQDKVIQYDGEITGWTKGQVMTTNATVYGAGKGEDTWSEYTEVNLNDGAMVYEAYGGGQMGHVLNAASVQQYMQTYTDWPSDRILEADPSWSSRLSEWQAAWKAAWTIGDYYNPDNDPGFTNYVSNDKTNLSRVIERSELDDKTASLLAGKKYNTNVIINQGATVLNYAYGGGLGDVKKPQSGDVYGTTYITLLGGTVNKDIYASGTAGGVCDLFGVGAVTNENANGFTASANVYVKGGMVRNVYGGGWRGSVGYHEGLISDVNNNDDDINGESHVVIGDLGDDKTFLSGDPAIMRNVYGGGEGGGIFGTAKVYVNNGHIGYRYKNTAAEGAPARYDYVAELDDQAVGDNLLDKSGNVFGGGYVANSYVDHSSIEMYGGTVRGCLYGGGEVGPIGRGTMNANKPKEDALQNGSAIIYKPGTTRLEMYGGHVLRNVFGGGRGHDNWDGEGYMTKEEQQTMDRSAKGYVFGQTLVHIHGGEIGTEDGLADNSGNVFGGGDYGFVYSAYENEFGEMCYGKKAGNRFDDTDEGYYYKNENGQDIVVDGEKVLTEDCKVLIEPYTKVLTGVTIDKAYAPGDYVPINVLNTLGNKKDDAAKWNCLDPTGIIIHNAVFAGGNTVQGSIVNANTVTVYGNATASIHDVYHRDLITLGTHHIGGLYGDGNLTLVDGYRGLNITNYGTDYYSIDPEITIDIYKTLPDREAAYYELKYKCKKACTDKDGTRYNPKDDNNESSKASTINADDLLVLFLENDGTPVKVDGEGNRVTTGDGEAVLEKKDGNWVPKTEFWEESGVLPIYAGRLMNSIQRADFCGVFGSRMVMRGAQDRVPEVADFTNYTINRVREVSLNQQHSVIPGDLALKTGGSTAGTREGTVSPEDEDPDNYVNLDKAIHGNYFGIYNIVNYLGALTSDVHFRTNEDKRRTSNTNDNYQPKTEAEKTYYGWKSTHINDRKRNNGTSLNKVALASGVYLELTTEKKQGTDLGLYEKDWGYITGVIELDLINVQTGIGGGFVYAKNEHGKPTYSKKNHATLTELNADAITRKDYTYDQVDMEEWETSGNFVHSTQTIIDDCYNISGKYSGADAVPAHYWYIKGQVYVYDQYISAYTGAPNAYSESVDIPLTITAASHGTMKLLDVMPNRYAFYSSPGVPLGYDKKVNINDIEYSKNAPISYWDWSLLSNTEKELFVEKTYVTNDSCKIGDTYYPSGYVMLPDEYESLMAAAQNHDIDGQTVKAVQKASKDKDGNPIVVKDDNDNIVWKAFDFVFRESNNLSHNTGYILAYKVNNPSGWDTWYTPKSNGSKITLAAYKELLKADQDKYEDGPTYRLKGSAGAVLGQRNYKVGDLISKNVEDTYQSIAQGNRPAGQATFGEAYLVTKQITVPDEETGGMRHLNPGAAVPASYATSHSGSVERAYICTSTISLGSSEYIYLDTRMTESEYNNYYNKYKDDNPTLAAEIQDKVVPAYYCTEEGPYGGNYYESGKNYRGLEAWSSMSETDREKFTFNYDALDLLIDPLYSKNVSGMVIHPEGQKYQYDSEAATPAGAEANPAGYSLAKPVDYTATYNSDSPMDMGEGNMITVTRYNSTSEKYESISVQSVEKDDELTRDVYESLINEQRHYTPITPTRVNNTSSQYKAYVVNTPILIGNSPYAVGQTLTASEYTNLSESYQSYVTELTFSGEGPYYYCREAYKIPDTEEGHAVKSVYGVTDTYAKGATVPLGAVIDKNNSTESDKTYYGYTNLTNNQKNFTIHGISPTETSTLYVSRESDIFDLSTEKIITVIYEYNYEESDTEGNATPVSERHVVNIHITFKSGVPTIDDIKAPQIVLPGDFISMIPPRVSEGAYEVTDYGWELFESPHDAESHTNGIEFTLDGDDADPLYLYQNGHLLAYYAKTYLGKTYSNHVPVSVANYHDLKKVMEAKEHHYYVDDPNVKEAKIYINDYSKDETGSKNGLDLLKQLFDLSVLDNPTLDNDGFIKEGDFAGHKTFSTHVRAARNLAFFLRTDIDHSGSGWSPIGSDNVCDDPSTSADEGVSGKCFDGTLHGDGHTITGLDHSLFAHLCGDVYNLGVTGSFTGAGIADEGYGYVENCWINTTGEPDGSVYAVFGNPSDETSPTPRQIVNSYYQAGKNYKTDANDRGVATAMSDQAFYNGEVAYDLNGFYLYKRYNDNAKPGGNTTYKYWLSGNDTPQEGHYAENKALCSSGYTYTPVGGTTSVAIKYVEDRFADGDFIYAGGTIPTSDDKRLHTYTVTDQSGNNKIYREYYPIWPDDYLFFGQNLTYGHIQGSTHDDVPTSYTNANRVYRAPAYFRSSTMGVAHFNPNAVFAQTKKGDDNVIVHKDMTAIDFMGHNDVTGGYGLGLLDTKFYPPLLDDGGLTDFTNVDLTKNLLVYTFASGGTGSDETPTAAQQTANVVSEYLKEPDYKESSDGYRTVAYQSPSNLHGHWVENGVATRNHFLVDKEDFNAPIAYTFASDMRMWYQRQPEDNEFVDRTKGWQGISLPFTAELVTTHQKGEITHFFSGSYESKDDKHAAKIGHEYWLREFTGISKKTENETVVANLTYPNSETSNKMNKTVTNTFLWDYYYKGSHSQLDHNKDTYQEYYKASRTYDNYALLSGGTPYLLGLPGVTYYEFDLSGKFKISTTSTPYPEQLDPQTITFASKPGETTIGVSDNEMAGVPQTYNSKTYTFRPNYLNNPEIAGQVAFLLNDEGNSYVKTEAAKPAVVAFRPFFTAPASGGTRAIIFGNEESELKGEVEYGDPRQNSFDGTLNIYAKKDKIYIVSQLNYTTDVRVVTPAGITVATATVKPGQTVEVQADFSGMYIVHTLDGLYTKSVIVKK